MRKNSFLNSSKGQGSGAAIAIIVIIVAVIAVLFLFPNFLGGISLPGIGTAPLGGVGAGTAGVIISGFVIEPPIIEGGDTVTFLITVENNGGIDAKSIEYKIFGLGDSKSWSGASQQQSGASTLEHQDVSRGLPGEVTSQEWESRAVEKNTDIAYPVTARVDYQYGTETDVILILLGRDNVNVKGTGIMQSTISHVTTPGPITVTPRGTIPLIGRTTNDFRISFDIVNVGGGRAYSGSIDSDLDRITVRFDGCDRTGSTDKVKLINGRRTVSCRVSTSGINSDDQGTKSLNIELEYNYIVEAASSVKVLRQTDQV